MLREPSPRTDQELIEIAQGLILLRKAGKYHQVWVTDKTIRVQKTAGGPKSILGWRNARDMARAAREAAAKALATEEAARKKPPAPERSERAQSTTKAVGES